MNTFNKIGMVIGNVINVVKKTDKVKLIGELTMIGVLAELLWYANIINWMFFSNLTDVLEFGIIVAIIIWVVERIRNKIKK